ncbi:hypothetical protein UB33_07000 [Photobacterium angustum]|nr:SH3 domain-containing protein [Photobacterium angustum]KJG06998.1 hypothetical protein UB33_07000 [Photobacterium angustum]
MNKLLKVFLSLSTSIIFFPNISAATERINVPVANMHEAANENSSIVSQAIYAEKVKIIKKDSNWFLIQSNDDYQGWVKSDEIIDVNNYFESGNIITTLSREPLIYRSPSTGEYKPLLKLPFGVKLTSIDNTDKTEQRWIKVRLLDGKTAWIQRGDIRVGLDKLNMAEMINLSQAFIGAPYTWGADLALDLIVQVLFNKCIKQWEYLYPEILSHNQSGMVLGKYQKHLLNPVTFSFLVKQK